MEWECDGQAAPGQRAGASACGRGSAASLAGLESAGASPGLHPAFAPSTADGPGGGEADHTRYQVHAAFPRCACPCSPLMGEAPGSQCASTRERAGDQQALRRTRSVRWVPRLASSSVHHPGHCAGVPLTLIAHERWQRQRRTLCEAHSPSVRVQGIVPRMLAMMSVPVFSGSHIMTVLA